MYLSTSDRPGLLARVARTLARHSLRVHNAKITTYGAQVEDSFIITTRHNEPIVDKEQQQILTQAIIETLDNDAD